MSEPSDPVREVTVSAFILGLGSAEPRHGAGAVCAVAASLGAGLLTRAAKLSMGDARLTARSATFDQVRAASTLSMGRLLDLADEDAQARAEIDAAQRHLPDAGPGEPADTAKHAALRHAVRVQREIMAECLSLVGDMEAFDGIGNADIARDIDVAARIVEAAARAAAAILVGRVAELDDPRTDRGILTESQQRLHDIASMTARLHLRA